ncbi:restriction endonuclease subunit S [Vibrio rotiferianus]|uniref:restriction endonuclease subunit S n=1 Tax=Vibrio rotiferianus TaxID=190895 RepID=UPI002893C4DE|nr:Type I restriction modification enzyme protein S [Vibrio rotiferianus]CAH1561774.1 Type I restriction modification enzyme protein S [Vibrio rotiferianus]
MSWPMVKLADIANVVTGATPKKRSEYYDGDVPFVTPGDLGETSGITSTSRTLTQEGADSVRSIPAGSVMVCCIGATIGKVGIAEKTVVTNQQINSLVVDERKAFPKYVYYYCATLKEKLKAASSSTTMPIVNKSNFSQFEIPLPPLDEQKRIAAILDKADAIRQKRKQAIDLADEFLRSAFLDMFGDPVMNPKGWDVKSLSEIARIQIGPFGTQLHKQDYIENGIPLINPTHIVRGDIIPKNNLTISSEKHQELTEYHLKTGDIVMGRRGEMGRCAIVNEREDGWLCGTGSLFIRPSKTGVFSEYLNKLLSSEAIKKHLEGESQGATMPNLNKTIVGNIKVPVPSDEALNQFSSIKSQFLRYLDTLHSFSSEKYFESLSHQSFSGQL